MNEQQKQQQITPEQLYSWAEEWYVRTSEHLKRAGKWTTYLIKGERTFYLELAAEAAHEGRKFELCVIEMQNLDSRIAAADTRLEALQKKIFDSVDIPKKPN